MLEERTFFGSKMLEIEDRIIIDDADIIYYQKTNQEQENLTQEKLLSPIIYSSSNEKEANQNAIDDMMNGRLPKSDSCQNSAYRELLKDVGDLTVRGAKLPGTMGGGIPTMSNSHYQNSLQ